MITQHNIILLFVAYLLGSIPTAVWVGKYFYNIDVREHGSGNAGATNVFRVLGKKAGIPVLIIDVLKGLFATLLSTYSNLENNNSELIHFQLCLGLAALIGHIFPVFASFKGGKGIATLLGIIIAIVPSAALIAISVFLITLIGSRIVSLSSMVAALAFPIIIIFIQKTNEIALVIFSISISIIVIITHRKNIVRLLKNEESKISFKSKKQDVH
ncbi:MAG: glycerol-3-phosphate 1-O-acyltransferase PlsY [Bacteroidia bacterium]